MKYGLCLQHKRRRTEDTQKVNSQVQSFLQYVSTSDACISIFCILHLLIEHQSTMCSTRLNPSGKNTHDNTKSVNAQYVQNTRTKYAEYINMIFRGSIAGKKNTQCVIISHFHLQFWFWKKGNQTLDYTSRV